MKMRPESWPLQSGNQAKQGRLAAAARPQQRDEFARSDGKIDRIQHRQRLPMKIELMVDHGKPDRRATHCGGHYHRSRPFCQDSSRSRRRNSSVIRPLHISAITISAAYMLE